MISYLFILLYGTANALRGSGLKWTPKWALALVLGISAYFLFDSSRYYCDYLMPCVVALGFLTSFSKGWSHMALHGWLDTKKKFAFITNLLNKFYKKMPIVKKLGEKGDKVWGILFMSTYALLMQYPQFIVLAVTSSPINSLPVVVGLLVLLKGVILYLVGLVFFKLIGEHSLRVFEFIYGCFLGGLLYIALI